MNLKDIAQLFTFTIVLILAVLYSWQMREFRREQVASQVRILELEQSVLDLQKIISELPLPTEQSSVVIAPIETKPTPPVVPEDPVDALYNPEKRANDDQSKSDALKKRFQDILVTYMFLRKCNRAEAGDYHIIISALAQEMASINAPGRLQYDVLTASEGAYKEMYANSVCNDASVDTLISQYKVYISALSQQLPPQP